MKAYIILLFCALPLFVLASVASTVSISNNEVVVGQSVTFTYMNDGQDCYVGSAVYPEGPDEMLGSVGSQQANFNAMPMSGALDGTSQWTYVYHAPGEYYVWFECGQQPTIQSDPKLGESKSLPIQAVAATGGLASANGNRISVSPAISVPTLSQWGLIILGLSMLSIGIVSLKKAKAKKSM